MPGHNAKPDFLDMDKDGDKREPMKGAKRGRAKRGRAKDKAKQFKKRARK